jgi:opacity protein-like surface antigen
MRKLLLIAVSLVALCSPAMAIDWDAKITSLDGSPIADDKGKPVELAVGAICVNALMSPSSDEPNMSGEEKIRRYGLALKIQTRDKSYVYTSEDIALIKKLVNKNYPSPLVVFHVWRELEAK